MAIAQGFGKTVHKNLIFGYDTGDMDNSFRGAPGTNIAMGPNRNYSGPSLSTYSNGKFFKSNGYTETVFIPTLGYRSVESVEVYNVYSSYGEDGNYNCCPSLFNYHGGQEFTGGTTYTYQIIYKCASGYTHPNYMYHYEYGPSGYITEYGVHTDSQRTHLGDGWYHAWNTFTTNAATTSGYKGMWYYQYNTPDKISVAAISIVPGTIIRPPRQFIDEGTTRSSTQALYDLTGTASLNLANVSYSSTGALVFDGSDDSILVGTIGNYSNSVTCEAVFKTTRGSGWNDMLCGGCNDIIFTVESNRLNFGAQCNSPIPHANYSASSVNTGNWVHGVATYNGSQVKIYINGSLEATYTRSGSFTPSSLRVGSANGGSSEFFQGELPVVKLYNRAITDAEVLQNFNHYKTRFGI